MPEASKPVRLIHHAQTEVRCSTGHRYHALETACEGMPVQALEDLVRMIRNLKQDAASERSKRRRGQFWG